jgi:hypothetical protein
MSRTTNVYALRPLSRGLSAVSARLEPREAAALLARAMSKTTDAFALRSLSQGLSSVSAGLEPKGAAEAAALLARAISKTTDPPALASLSEGLSAVSARLEPREAARACGQAASLLTHAMSKTTDAYALGSLSQGLSAVLSLEPSSHTRERHVSLAALVGLSGSPGTPFASIGGAEPALKPLPPPLAAQMLVDLLKHPLCVGEARRLVLGQLSRHYNRPFADQWEFVEYVHQHKLKLDLDTPPEPPKVLTGKQ